MRVAYRKNLDIYVRPNSSDDYVCDEVIDYDPVFTNYSGSGTILDLGANIGAFARRAIIRYPQSSLVCLEPDRQAYNMLLRNIREFNANHIITYHSAVGSNKGQIILYSSPNPDHFSGHTTIKDYANEGIYEEELVEVIAFDDLLSEHNPEIVKIDIEGAELECIIQSKLFPHHIKGLAIEIHANQDTIQIADATILRIKESFPYILGESNIPTPRKEKLSTTMIIALRN